jgi:hypothetical protein
MNPTSLFNYRISDFETVEYDFWEIDGHIFKQ